MKGLMNFSPLGQFDIIPLKFMNIYGIDVSVTNMSLTVLICLMVCYFYVESQEIYLVPTINQLGFESSFNFLYNLVYSQLGWKGLIYLPFLSSLFFFILFFNLMGLMPVSFAVTSQFIWTLYFSTSMCLGIFFVGIRNYGFKFFKVFVPNVPFLLYPLLIILEVLSYIIRSMSLAVSLSANITAGHILVHILTGIVFNLFYLGFDLIYLVVLLLFGLFFLEFGVACLQAYVFTLLVCIYLNDAVHLNLH